MDISDPTIPDIANFLNYLFKEKNLKPSTIAGYRTAIADGLGLKGEDVSKSLELNRLLASFYRDKPVANRSIPPWDLASDGPPAIKPVVIPALKPHLDSTLTRDRSLCPVRALKYYLDRTKDLRKNKNFLFVAIKEGFSRDISRATISSWLKQYHWVAFWHMRNQTPSLNNYVK